MVKQRYGGYQMSQSSDIRIAVIYPSRGLVFSQSADELLQNLQGFEYDIFFAHSLPIPLCFEKPLKNALNGNFTHIFFIEDDMILPESTLDAMIIADKDVVAMDYPVSKEGQGAVFYSEEGQVIFTGTGCLLIKRGVFDELREPYFRTDICWNVINYGDSIRMTANKIDNPNLEGYGLHDTNFGIKLKEIGFSTFIAGTIGQRKLVSLGKTGSNEGAHNIEEWTRVKPNSLLKKFQAMPVQPRGALITVQTINGELTVHPDKAKSLIKAGVATRLPKRSIVFDFNGLKI